MAESPRHTPVQQGLLHLGLWHAHLQSERSGLHIVQLPLEPFITCPRESDLSFDLWGNVGACVDKATVQNLHRLSIHLAYCFDGER